MRNINTELKCLLELALEEAQAGSKRKLAYLIAKALDELCDPETTEKEKVNY